MTAPQRLPDWPTLTAAAPTMCATMRRYLEQLRCSLRPGSVGNADQALRAFAAFLTQTARSVSSVAAVERRHVEQYKRWLAARPGRDGVRVAQRR